MPQDDRDFLTSVYVGTTPTGEPDYTQYAADIVASSITRALIAVNPIRSLQPGTVRVSFVDTLTGGDVTELDSVNAAHTGTPASAQLGPVMQPAAAVGVGEIAQYADTEGGQLAASGLQTVDVVERDGSVPFTGNINAGGNDITNVGTVDGVTVSNHSARHENAGADEINVDGLSGLLADDQNPTAHAADHQNGGPDEINVDGLSGLLGDAQTPTDHATAHEDGGGDEINIGGLSGEAADPQPPKAHAADHLPAGSDPLTTAAPVSVAGPTNGTGSAESFSRADHQHKLALGIGKAGSVAGSQPEINFEEGTNITLTVVNDVPNDRVNVTINGSGGEANTLALIGSATGVDITAAKLGSALQVKGVKDGTRLGWVIDGDDIRGDVDITGLGDVSGPAGATADRLASYDGASGKLIKDSSIATADVVVRDGSVPFTGNINAGGNNITNVGTVDGVTVSNHSARHENAGADEINVGGLSGLLADDQNPTAHATDHQNGGGDEINVGALSGVLADAQKADTLVETDGPTDLAIGDVLDMELLRRAGSAITGIPLLGGGTAGEVWTFDSATADADPALGFFRLNNAAPASATFLFMHTQAFSNSNMSAIYSAMASGYFLLVQCADDPMTYLRLEVTGVPNIVASRVRIPIDLDGTGGSLTAGKKYTLARFVVESGGGGGATIDNFSGFHSVNQAVSTTPIFVDYDTIVNAPDSANLIYSTGELTAQRALKVRIQGEISFTYSAGTNPRVKVYHTKNGVEIPGSGSAAEANYQFLAANFTMASQVVTLATNDTLRTYFEVITSGSANIVGGMNKMYCSVLEVL